MSDWLKKVWMWDWHDICVKDYSGWEIDADSGVWVPAFVKLVHHHKKGPVESHKLCIEWDDHAKVAFYQRDWTDDSIPVVRAGETYWSGWWFQTLAERDRFLEYFGKRIRVDSVAT